MTEPTVVLPAAPEPKKRRIGLIATGIAVPVLLVGGAAYAYQQLNGGGTQPDDVLPSTVIAYARLDADPSASQKIKLFKLIRKSPDLAREFGIKTDTQDLRKEIVKGILGDCDNIDYDKDIKPWLGNRIGIGVTDARGEKGLVAIQVTDEKEARKGLELTAGCLGMADPGVSFSKGYALVGPSQKDVDAAVKAAAKQPLSASAEFTEDTQSLGDQGIASVWVSAEAFVKEYADELPDAATRKKFENLRSAALAVRAGDDNIELTTIGHTNSDLGKLTNVNLGGLPASSVLAASFAGGGKSIVGQWDAFKDGFVQGFSAEGGPGISKGDIDQGITEIEKQTGFKLPEDLATLLGDEITFVVGDTNLSKLDSIEGPADLTRLDIALAMRSKSGPATDLAKRIATEVAKYTGVELSVVSTKDGAVLASNEAFARNFNHGADLSGKDEFTSVIDHDTSVASGVFFDISTLVKALQGMDMPASDKKDLDQFKDLKAFGISASKDGDRVIRGTIKLSFK